MIPALQPSRSRRSEEARTDAPTQTPARAQTAASDRSTPAAPTDRADAPAPSALDRSRQAASRMPLLTGSTAEQRTQARAFFQRDPRAAGALASLPARQATEVIAYQLRTRHGLSADAARSQAETYVQGLREFVRHDVRNAAGADGRYLVRQARTQVDRLITDLRAHPERAGDLLRRAAAEGRVPRELASTPPEQVIGALETLRERLDDLHGTLAGGSWEPDVHTIRTWANISHRMGMTANPGTIAAEETQLGRAAQQHAGHQAGMVGDAAHVGIGLYELAHGAAAAGSISLGVAAVGFAAGHYIHHSIEDIDRDRQRLARSLGL